VLQRVLMVTVQHYALCVHTHNALRMSGMSIACLLKGLSHRKYVSCKHTRGRAGRVGVAASLCKDAQNVYVADIVHRGRHRTYGKADCSRVLSGLDGGGNCSGGFSITLICWPAGWLSHLQGEGGVT
jgi:hypothetical protein